MTAVTETEEHPNREDWHKPLRTENIHFTDIQRILHDETPPGTQNATFGPSIGNEQIER